jgi:hypothetical protein
MVDASISSPANRSADCAFVDTDSSSVSVVIAASPFVRALDYLSTSEQQAQSIGEEEVAHIFEPNTRKNQRKNAEAK